MFQKNVYCGLFHCHLLYGFQIWGHYPYTIKMFRLKKCALPILVWKPKTEHCKNVFIDNQILTFPDIYVYTSLVHCIVLYCFDGVILTAQCTATYLRSIVFLRI